MAARTCRLVFLITAGAGNVCLGQAPAPHSAVVVTLPGPIFLRVGQGANRVLSPAPIPRLGPLPHRVRVYTDSTSGLPPGVSMTPTFVDLPSTPSVMLHFEASANAPVVTSQPAYVYAGDMYQNYVTFLVTITVAPSQIRPLLPPTLKPLDQSTQAALVSGSRSGADIELWVGDSAGLVPIASSTAPASPGDARIRLPHRLSPGQIVHALQKFAPLTSRLSAPVVVENNYVTNRYDNERSGWNPNESILTVSNVRNGLQKICDHQVDRPIRAQPLYVQDVDIGGKKHNVVLAATDGDQVWAFDADSCVPGDKGLWIDAKSGQPGPRKLLDEPTEAIPGTGAVPAKCSLTYGIWSTPVIDRTTNTMYVVASVQKGTDIFFRLHALDISTGQDRATVEIRGATTTFTHGGVPASMDPSVQQNRPGLLLDRGVIYLAFGSCGDVGSPYHGWVLAYDADLPGSPTFLNQLGVFNTSPTQTGSCNTTTSSPPCMAGVWQAGLGLAADGDGTVYLITGNGDFNPTQGRYGNTLLRLRLPTSPASKEMQVVNFFTPYDWDGTYNLGDEDFGAGGPVLFAERMVTAGISAGATSGPKRYILAGGKPHKSYLIDRDCTNCNGYVPGRPDDPNLVIHPLTQPEGMVAGPAYYTGPSGTRIYYGWNWSPMTAYRFQPSAPFMATPQMTPDCANTTSPIPTISSNGSAAGTAILWAAFHPTLAAHCPAALPYGAVSSGLTLHAYDAENINDNLFSARTQKSLDIAGWGSSLGNSFQVPTVIHGKVYAGSDDRLVVFGLRRRPHCVPRLDWNSRTSLNSVTFLCLKEDFIGLVLQQKIGTQWNALTDAASSREVTDDFVYVWDYPSGETVTYRVCPKEQPDACTPEVTLTVPTPTGVRGELKPESRCGKKGTPPCFMDEPWPQDPGARRPQR
jgi:hypothetical protein